jgi:branched-subunit amino acid aminotransferase/4-amino-4-deoxychorismate lyase
MEYYLHQGKITADPDFNPKEEWLYFPVKVKTSMWFAHGEIPFFENHISTINHYFGTLQQPFNIDMAQEAEMKRLIRRLINKNKAFMGGWVHVNLFVSKSEWRYIGTIEKYSHREIPFDEQGKLVTISSEIKWSKRISENSVPGMKPLWENEKLKLEGSRYGDSIFCNENGSVVESIGSNIYCIDQDKLYTPSMDTGCYEDNFRQLTLDSALQLDLKIIESDKLTPKELMLMDEIFTASECNGFRWVLGIDNKRFVRKKAESIRNGVEFLLWKNRQNLIERR